MKIGVYVSLIASERGHERNVSGHIQVAARTLELLRNAGHEVHLISNRFGPEHVLPACVPTDVETHLVDDGRRRASALRGVSERKGIRITALLKQILQMRQVVKAEGLDVLHVFGFARSAMLGGALRIVGGTPVVVTLVGEPDLAATTRPAGRVMMRRADVVLTATECVARSAASVGLRTHIVRHGVVRDLTAELGSTRADARHRALFWRDASVVNGADLCMTAFDAVAPEHPDVSFDFAVRPFHDEVPGLDALAERHPNVHVHRFPYAEGITLPKLVAESLVAVLPFRQLSVEPQFSVAETLAAGVPVIGSDVTSMPELIEHGRTGMIVPAGAAAPVTAALRELLADRPRLETMVAGTRERFTSRWHWRDYVDQLEGHYCGVARAGGAGRHVRVPR